MFSGIYERFSESITVHKIVIRDWHTMLVEFQVGKGISLINLTYISLFIERYNFTIGHDWWYNQSHDNTSSTIFKISFFKEGSSLTITPTVDNL